MRKLLTGIFTLIFLFSIHPSCVYADTDALEYKELTVEIPEDEYEQDTGADIWELIATGRLNLTITAHYYNGDTEAEAITIHPARCTISPEIILEGEHTYRISYKDMNGTRRHATLRLTGYGEVEEVFTLDESTGKWYMQASDGSFYENIWKRINGKWHLFDDDGYVVTGWHVQNGIGYYLDPDEYGAMCTDWAYVDDCWYHFTDSGIFSNGWILDSDKWYFINDDGTMKTGWLYDNDIWYYLTPGSGECAIGWKLVDGKWYYFAPDGAMAADTVIDGYYVDSDGIWIP